MNNSILIAGATASGKSNLALRLAQELQGVIINTDSLQVYNGLEIITARPNKDELCQAEHFLYGFVEPFLSFSTGEWLRAVKDLLTQIKDRPVIFVGGTGLYFRALLGGLAEIPNISNDVRQRWRHALAEKGKTALYELLVTKDRDTADKISANDGQRIIRALEVFDMTGKPLSFWQKQRSEPLINAENAIKIVLSPDRDALYKKIDRRFDMMVQKGAVEEVQEFLRRDLNPSLPAMKAIGVDEFRRFLCGEVSLDNAVALAKMHSRQYAKRQMTWFRNQLREGWQIISEPQHFKLT